MEVKAAFVDVCSTMTDASSGCESGRLALDSSYGLSVRAMGSSESYAEYVSHLVK